MLLTVSLRTKRELLTIFLCGLVSLAIYGVIASLGDLLSRSTTYILLSLAAFLVMLVAFHFCRAGGRVFLAAMLFSLIFRVAMFFAPVTLSADVYRYVWDGRVTLSGKSPYHYKPSAPELADLRDEVVYDQISSTDYYSIYPPLAQAMFALGALMGKHSTLAMRMIFTMFDAGTVAMLVLLADALGRERRNVLLYAWNPLPITEFSGSGHSDSLMIFLFLLAVWLLVRRRIVAGWIVFVGSIAVRYVPGITFPLAVAAVKPRKPLTACALVAATALLVFGPFFFDAQLIRNWRETSYLYSGTFIFNSSLFSGLLWLLEHFNPSSRLREVHALAFVCNGIFAVVWVSIVIQFWRNAEMRGIREYLATSAWLFALYFFATPNVQVWYLSWFLVLVPLIYSALPIEDGIVEKKRIWPAILLQRLARPHTALLAWSGLAVLAYQGYAANVFGVPAALLWIEYGTVLALITIQLIYSGKNRAAIAHA